MQGLLKIIQKFEKTGSLYVRPGRERKRIDLTVVVEMATSGGRKPCSARGIARPLDRPCDHGA